MVWTGTTQKRQHDKCKVTQYAPQLAENFVARSMSNHPEAKRTPSQGQDPMRSQVVGSHLREDDSREQGRRERCHAHGRDQGSGFPAHAIDDVAPEENHHKSRYAQGTACVCPEPFVDESVKKVLSLAARSFPDASTRQVR